jgi:hypothetical protein
MEHLKVVFFVLLFAAAGTFLTLVFLQALRGYREWRFNVEQDKAEARWKENTEVYSQGWQDGYQDAVRPKAYIVRTTPDRPPAIGNVWGGKSVDEIIKELEGK